MKHKLFDLNGFEGKNVQLIGTKRGKDGKEVFCIVYDGKNYEVTINEMPLTVESLENEDNFEMRDGALGNDAEMYAPDDHYYAKDMIVYEEVEDFGNLDRLLKYNNITTFYTNKRTK